LLDAPSRFFSGTAVGEWTLAADSADYKEYLLGQLSIGGVNPVVETGRMMNLRIGDVNIGFVNFCVKPFPVSAGSRT
jgi:hypothetical protein